MNGRVTRAEAESWADFLEAMEKADLRVTEIRLRGKEHQEGSLWGVPFVVEPYIEMGEYIL